MLTQRSFIVHSTALFSGLAEQIKNIEDGVYFSMPLFPVNEISDFNIYICVFPINVDLKYYFILAKTRNIIKSYRV